MNNIESYIESGVLELYVCGALSTEESYEVSQELKKHPEIKKEVEIIEAALYQLSTAAAPYDPQALLYSIQQKITQKNNTGVIEHPSKKKANWVLYMGWAASIALLIGLISVLNDKNELRERVNELNASNAQLEQQIENANESEQDAKELLAIFRDKNINSIPLEGQEVAPEAYAVVHWDKNKNQVFIDAQNLPEPPPGKEYQVWSLTFEPLSPTSIGLLSDFENDENKIFRLENPNQSQGFGITLEPKGGSKTPTMEQLYTLGTVKS